jgi:hypothetical protein
MTSQSLATRSEPACAGATFTALTGVVAVSVCAATARPSSPCPVQTGALASLLAPAPKTPSDSRVDQRMALIDCCNSAAMSNSADTGSYSSRPRSTAVHRGLKGSCRGHSFLPRPELNVRATNLARGLVTPASNARPSTSASSMAMQAPCPRNGVIGWAASPSIATRPSTHVASGSRSRNPT